MKAEVRVMGMGMLALFLLLPAIAVAVILAFFFAISAAWNGNTLTTIASLVSLLMILSPGFFASFATRPQADDENPMFLIEYGVLPSALLGIVLLAFLLALRRRYKLLTASALLLVLLAFLPIIHAYGTATGVDGLGPPARGILNAGAILMAAYPVIWVLVFRELSEYAAPRLAKLKQG